MCEWLTNDYCIVPLDSFTPEEIEIFLGWGMQIWDGKSNIKDIDIKNALDTQGWVDKCQRK